MQVENNVSHIADGHIMDSSNSHERIPTLPELEPEIGVPDEATAQFMETRLMAHRLSLLSGEHLQVGMIQN